MEGALAVRALNVRGIEDLIQYRRTKVHPARSAQAVKFWNGGFDIAC
jgi:hypothetical protein